MNRHSQTQRIMAVCEYIEQHLDEPLDSERLCRVAHFSRHHFHRVFAGLTGWRVHQYIQRLRLKRASYQLVFEPERKLIDIALMAGFENPESFSRAFKRTVGQTPSAFRQQPRWQSWHLKCRPLSLLGQANMQVEITQFDSTPIAVLEHRGPVRQLNHSVAKFIQWRQQSGLSPVDRHATFGIAYDDPEAVPEAEFRFDICAAVPERVPDNPQGVGNKVIPGGRCAKIRHTGPHDLMDDKIRYLYGPWLAQSGEALRDFPVFFHYLNFFPEVDEHQLVTDIYLPLETPDSSD